MRNWVRFLALLLGLPLLLGLVFLGLAWNGLRSSLPQEQGQVEVIGLGAPTEVIRDSYGVPYISARSDADLFFTLGYVHAQDRLFQMDMTRKVGFGRLSELVGEEALDVDIFMRTLGLGRAAEAAYDALNAQTRADLEAYAAGVNAFLAEGAALPPEYLVLRLGQVAEGNLRRYRPEPWEPAHSLVYMKLMVWDLSNGHLRRELGRLDMAGRLPPEAIAHYYRAYPGEPPLILPDLNQIYGTDIGIPRPGTRGSEASQTGVEARETSGAYSTRFHSGSPAVGSNSWVASSERTTGQGGGLANDPHLALQLPSVWYFAALDSAEGVQMIGATLPGVPWVIIGRNDFYAMGLTNVNPDIIDLRVERVTGVNQVATPNGSERLSLRNERIEVRGGESLELAVRESAHGPLITDSLRDLFGLKSPLANSPDYGLSIRWTALDPGDTSANTIAAMNRATSHADWEAALADFQAPQQNLVYLDVEGRIDYATPGRVPIRDESNLLDGLVPAPAWESLYDWQSFLAFEDLPRRLNPIEGLTITANARIGGPDYPHHITHDWSLPYRTERIAERIAAVGPLDLDRMAEIQLDERSNAAEHLLTPLLEHLDPALLSVPALEAAALLTDWDLQADSDRPHMSLFAAWQQEVNLALLIPQVGADVVGFEAQETGAYLLYERFRRPRPDFVLGVLADENGAGRWCGSWLDESVPEDCVRLVSIALNSAVKRLEETYGSAQPDWGELHPANLNHLLADGLPAPLGRLFNRTTQKGGGWYSVNVAAWEMEGSMDFAATHVASMRMLVDGADMEASRWIHYGGQSGHPLSATYSSFTEAWSRGDYVPMHTRRRDALVGSRGTLELRPLMP